MINKVDHYWCMPVRVLQIKLPLIPQFVVFDVAAAVLSEGRNRSPNF